MTAELTLGVLLTAFLLLAYLLMLGRFSRGGSDG
jgi:hypothetical protein